MSKKAAPTAWDDDWETQADLQEEEPPPEPQPPVKVSKAERLAKHAELNRKIWEDAETPDTPFFVQSRNDVPLKSDFKPAVKLLSRKPAPQMLARKDPVTGMSQLTVEDGEEEDTSKDRPLSPEEQRQKALREREEKQRKYNEVRERLFGSPASPAGSSQATPGNISPVNIGQEGKPSRGKGKGRSGRESQSPASPRSRSRPESRVTETRQLYDPGYTIKPDSVYIQKRNTDRERSDSERSSPAAEQQPIRQPVGPNGSGRGGFGFSARGAKVN